MSQPKITASIAVRPGLLEKVDDLAKSCGKSRSEIIGRILSSVIDDLSRPEMAWIKIERKHFQQLLTI